MIKKIYCFKFDAYLKHILNRFLSSDVKFYNEGIKVLPQFQIFESLSLWQKLNSLEKSHINRPLLN